MDGTERKPSFENLSAIWQRRKEKIKLRTEKPEFPFGLRQLDDVSHGITKGKVTIISGRTSEAKSSFALQAAYNIAEMDKTIAYISLEDDVEQISERLFSNRYEIDNQELLRGKTPHFMLDNQTVVEVFSKVRFLAVQDYGYNFQEIRTVIEAIDPKPDLVFLDYVQMIDQEKGETEYEALSRFARECKKFAEINDVGLVIISQINRAGANAGKPSVHHLQGCGKLEQVADLLLILYRPYAYNDSSYDFEEGYDSAGRKIVIAGMKNCPEDYVEVEVAKNKNGMRNYVVPLKFIGKFYKFEEWRNG